MSTLQIWDHFRFHLFYIVMLWQNRGRERWCDITVSLVWCKKIIFEQKFTYRFANEVEVELCKFSNFLQLMQLCYRIEIFICIYLLSEVIWLIPKPWKFFICTEQSKWTKQRRYPSIVCNWVCLFVHYLFMNAHLVCGSLHILYTTVDQKFSTHKIWHLNSWLIGRRSRISKIKTETS